MHRLIGDPLEVKKFLQRRPFPQLLLPYSTVSDPRNPQEEVDKNNYLLPVEGDFCFGFGGSR